MLTDFNIVYIFRKLLRSSIQCEYKLLNSIYYRGVQMGPKTFFCSGPYGLKTFFVSVHMDWKLSPVPVHMDRKLLSLSVHMDWKLFTKSVQMDWKHFPVPVHMDWKLFFFRSIWTENFFLCRSMWTENFNVEIIWKVFSPIWTDRDKSFRSHLDPPIMQCIRLGIWKLLNITSLWRHRTWPESEKS